MFEPFCCEVCQAVKYLLKLVAHIIVVLLNIYLTEDCCETNLVQKQIARDL